MRNRHHRYLQVHWVAGMLCSRGWAVRCSCGYLVSATPIDNKWRLRQMKWLVTVTEIEQRSKPGFFWLHQMTCHVSQWHFRRFTFLLKERKLSLKNLLKNIMLTSFMLTYDSWMLAYVYTALYNFQCSLAHVILITIFLIRQGSCFFLLLLVLFCFGF